MSDDECDITFYPFEQALPRSQSNIGPQKPFSQVQVSPTRISIIDRDMVQLGITYKELDERCSDLFSEAPIPFIPRSRNQLEETMADSIDMYQVKIPVVHISNSSYLIGINKCICELRGNKVMIRIGGGYESFGQYIQNNEQYFER
jgi:hypothetical protein